MSVGLVHTQDLAHDWVFKALWDSPEVKHERINAVKTVTWKKRSLSSDWCL